MFPLIRQCWWRKPTLRPLFRFLYAILFAHMVDLRLSNLFQVNKITSLRQGHHVDANNHSKTTILLWSLSKFNKIWQNSAKIAQGRNRSKIINYVASGPFIPTGFQPIPYSNPSIDLHGFATGKNIRCASFTIPIRNNGVIIRGMLSFSAPSSFSSSRSRSREWQTSSSDGYKLNFQVEWTRVR